MLTEITRWAGIWWCRLFHSAPMAVIHGQYKCRVCLRSIRVAWD